MTPSDVNGVTAFIGRRCKFEGDSHLGETIGDRLDKMGGMTVGGDGCRGRRRRCGGVRRWGVLTRIRECWCDGS